MDFNSKYLPACQPRHSQPQPHVQLKPKGEDEFDLAIPEPDSETELEASLCSNCDISEVSQKRSTDTTCASRRNKSFAGTKGNGDNEALLYKNDTERGLHCSLRNAVKTTTTESVCCCSERMKRRHSSIVEGEDYAQLKALEKSLEDFDTFSPVVLHGNHPEEGLISSRYDESDEPDSAEIHNYPSQTPPKKTPDRSPSKMHMKLNYEDNNGFHELSSIYEKTEEELCTPDCEFKLNYSNLQDYKKARKERDNKRFHTLKSNLNNHPEFYSKKPGKKRNSQQRKISKKRADCISQRLYKSRECSLERKLKNSKSFKEINEQSQAKQSLDSISKNIFKNKRKSLVKDYKLPVYTTKQRNPKPKRKSVSKQKEYLSGNKILSSHKPLKNKQKAKQKKLIHKKMLLEKLKLQALKLESEIRNEALELKSMSPEINAVSSKAQRYKLSPEFAKSRHLRTGSMLNLRNSVISKGRGTSSFVRRTSKMTRSSTISSLQFINIASSN
ncbi:unnamed protein product [Moneuplotes crassus]|uniref:Uncharacterized protein n=1 Tax=Euplotes crassus TaxID=5936 RepID=A0AAD2DBP4_EUPCR|nr:unnamed protein product [Moneuplotes crassus]